MLYFEFSETCNQLFVLKNPLPFWNLWTAVFIILWILLLPQFQLLNGRVSALDGFPFFLLLRFRFQISIAASDPSFELYFFQLYLLLPNTYINLDQSFFLIHYRLASQLFQQPWLNERNGLKVKPPNAAFSTSSYFLLRHNISFFLYAGQKWKGLFFPLSFWWWGLFRQILFIFGSRITAAAAAAASCHASAHASCRWCSME